MPVSRNIKTLKTTSVLVKPATVVTKIRNFTLTQDIPKGIGGEDKGPTPTEVLLASLAGCIGIVMAYHSKRFNVDIDELKIDVEGDYDPRGFMGYDVKAGFTEIRARIEIKTNSPRDRVEKLVRFVESHCPISDTLTSPTKVSIKYSLK